MGARSYDAIDMHPYEVIFMPLEQRMLDVRFGAAVVASKYSTWVDNAWVCGCMGVGGVLGGVYACVWGMCVTCMCVFAIPHIYSISTIKPPSIPQERRNISENEFMRYENAYREIQRAMLQQLDKRCFDVAYYRNNNPDLQGYDDDFLWAQWLSHGQFEARRWSFTCHRMSPG